MTRPEASPKHGEIAAPRLLLVGGHVGTRASTAVALSGTFAVDTAATATEARRRISAPPDVVVCDVAPPATESRALLGVLRKEVPGCSILVSSAEQEADVLRVLAPHSIDGFLATPVHIDQLLRSVVAVLSRSSGGPWAAPVVSQKLSRAAHYVSCHHRGKLTVEAIARGSGLAERSLRRCFRDELDMGAWEFVNRVRVEVARHFVTSTDEKHEVVADLAGFYDSSHMSRLIHRYTGRRPKHHRHQARLHSP